MNISAPFIQRPIATALLMLGLLVGGLVAYPLLPVGASTRSPSRALRRVKDDRGWFPAKGHSNNRINQLPSMELETFGGQTEISAWRGRSRFDTERFLKPRQSRTDTAGSDWAIQTPKWPHGKSVRSIVFHDPFQRGD
jgi:hypothetical protein